MIGAVPHGPSCVICFGPDATMTTKALNGLPVGVVACEGCRQAVRDRIVGVTVRADGAVSITDARLPLERRMSA